MTSGGDTFGWTRPLENFQDHRWVVGQVFAVNLPIIYPFEDPQPTIPLSLQIM